MQETQRRDFLKTTAATIGVVGAATLGASAASAQESKSEKRRIVAINTSHRAGKTCAESIQVTFDAIRELDPDLELEMLELAPMNIGFQLVGEDQPADDLDEVLAKIIDPACVGVLIASPVYNGFPSARCAAMISRFSKIRAGWLVKNKILGLIAVAAGRNGGQETVLHQLSDALLAQQFILAVDAPPTSHWGGTLWNQDNTIAKDEYGIKTAQNVGKRMVELINLVYRR